MNNRKWNFFSHFQASVKKTSLSKSFSFSPRVSNLIFKQEMESFRQEMELFFTLWGLLSKAFFFKIFHVWSKRFKIFTYLDLSWPILTYLDLSWQILTNIDLWWPILTHFNLSWPILTHIELSWPILTSRNALQLFHYPACFVGFIPELSFIFF